MLVASVCSEPAAQKDTQVAEMRGEPEARPTDTRRTHVSHIHSNQGSYREPKVLNVLEFNYFVRVPSNVLELVLNVLDCLESVYC